MLKQKRIKNGVYILKIKDADLIKLEDKTNEKTKNIKAK